MVDEGDCLSTFGFTACSSAIRSPRRPGSRLLLTVRSGWLPCGVAGPTLPHGSRPQSARPCRGEKHTRWLHQLVTQSCVTDTAATTRPWPRPPEGPPVDGVAMPEIGERGAQARTRRDLFRAPPVLLVDGADWLLSLRSLTPALGCHRCASASTSAAGRLPPRSQGPRRSAGRRVMTSLLRTPGSGTAGSSRPPARCP